MKNLKDIKLLLNAEAFGFGPTAAIASFFPYLRAKVGYLAFVGKNHTLDLQKTLAYDKVFDISGLSSEEEKKELKKIMQNYDAVLTALDFKVAEIAKQSDLFTGIYDPLTWYWKTIPSIVKEADIYLAQNFIGVIEKLKDEAVSFGKVEIVPPIVEKITRNDSKYILLNLGGLLNPFWERT